MKIQRKDEYTLKLEISQYELFIAKQALKNYVKTLTEIVSEKMLQNEIDIINQLEEYDVTNKTHK